MIQNILKNWKTTLVGLLAGGTISIDAVIRQGLTSGWKQALLGLAIALIGALAHDAQNPKANS